MGRHAVALLGALLLAPLATAQDSTSKLPGVVVRSD